MGNQLKHKAIAAWLKFTLLALKRALRKMCISTLVRIKKHMNKSMSKKSVFTGGNVRKKNPFHHVKRKPKEVKKY